MIGAKLAYMLRSLGLHSLRSRYLMVSIVASLLLIIAAVGGWHYVEAVTANQLSNLQHRTDATDAMSNAATQTHLLEIQFYRFIILPSESGREEIQHTFQRHNAAINKLRNNAWIQQDSSLLELLMALQNDHVELAREIQNLLDVRSDEKKWFPAMASMQGKMLNYNMQFMLSLELMLHEIDDELATPGRLEIYKTLMETRHNWQLMIGEFRLFVANSFGVFSSNSQQGMRVRKNNIDLYYARLEQQFEKLSNHEHAGELDLVSHDSLQDMQQSFTSWHQDYERVVRSYRSDTWRQDLVLLREQVEPTLARIRQRTSSLQLELGVATAKDITRLTRLAHNFSDFVIYLVCGIIAAGMLGYVVFHRTILRPIADVAQALLDEAGGKQRVRVPLSSTDEFRNLTTAFASMREQIRMREAHLDHMAHYDSLTQLPNRVLFQFRLEHALAHALRNHTQVGLMFLDLDRFKQINDTLGHDIGDRLLQIIAVNLKACLRETDTIARLGGDEFAIIFENVTHADQMALTARKILKEFKQPFMLGDVKLHTTTSIGIAFGPKDANSVESLTKNADIAMYHAKSVGRNTFKFYASEMTSEVIHRVNLENQLRLAIDNKEFILYYQPIVELRTGRIISTEALLRWQHPERGLLAPSEFLPVLIDSGLIKPVTQWILIEAGKQYQSYKATGQTDIRIAVNMAGFAFRNDSILDLVLTAIEHTQMDPRGLIVEITEDTLLEELHNARNSLKELQSMGIRIALDDFGTGQSSLNHLRHSPIDIIKIDRDFINNIPSDSNDSDLVDAIIAMAHKLHISVVAEGVENKEQLDFLNWHKCDAIQGYYFSAPRPATELLAMLSEDRRMPG
jgi:diguanylate cyclase